MMIKSLMRAPDIRGSASGMVGTVLSFNRRTFQKWSGWLGKTGPTSKTVAAL